uniref:SET domain-containing protein n=1 Tax=Odontella aurita TaxID=265563 RepID=A0A7S4MLG1_9STRA
MTTKASSLARLLRTAAPLLLLLLVVVASAKEDAEEEAGTTTTTTISPPLMTEHDPSISHMIEYFTSRGIYYHPSQTVRREDPSDPSSRLGVYASADIPKDTLLVSIPWNCTINAGIKIDNPTHLSCATVRNLMEEMKMGERNESKFGPYVQYLSEQRRGQLPSAWSAAGKDLLSRVLDEGGEENSLPPGGATDLLEDDWRRGCGGSDDPFEENAAMLVTQRAEDDLILPLYDFYNHRNGEYLSLVNKKIEHSNYTDFEVYAGRDITKGEQIYGSYNQCSNCGGRVNVYGTPDIFRDYGFIESYPQRWIFRGPVKFGFDLLEKVEGSGEISFRWTEEGRPLLPERRREGAAFFRGHVLRLERLRMEEEEKRRVEEEERLGKGGESGAGVGVPEYEWNMIWSFVDATVLAMTHAIENALKDDEDETGADDACDAVGEDGTCSASAASGRDYDPLETSLSDNEYYYDSPYDSTLACGGDGHLYFDGKTVHEDLDTMHQIVEYFSLPDGDVCFDLDDVLQICTSYRPHYHEPMLDYAARYVHDVRRVLFVGGGDSMLLAEAMKYHDTVELVVGLELEQDMPRKTFKYMHTQPLFHDRRVEWWFGDAVKSLRLLPRDYFGSFDLVLVDLSETVASFSVSSHLDMMEALALLLKPTGVMVKNEWRYLEKMSGIFKYAARINLPNVPWICNQAMTFGSNEADFLNFVPRDHGVQRRLLGLDDAIDERFGMFHDYKKSDVTLHKSCAFAGDDDSSESDLEKEKSEGITLVVNAENTTVPLEPFDPVMDGVAATLKDMGLTVLSVMTSSPSAVENDDDNSDDDDASVGSIIFLREGYVSARAWPSKKYCAFDVFLWAKFEHHVPVKRALLDAVGTDDASYSDYRIVTSGMMGTPSWSDDRDLIGPRYALKKACVGEEESETDERRREVGDEGEGGDGGATSSSSGASTVENVLREGLDLFRNRDDGIVVVCGAEGATCESLEVLSAIVVADDDDDANEEEKVTALWTCPGIAEEAEIAGGIKPRTAECEGRTLAALERRGRATGALVVDPGAPPSMIRILHGVLRVKENRKKILAENVALAALTGPPGGRNKEARRNDGHNFLDRVRRMIGFSPLFRAEIVVKNRGQGGGAEEDTMELGILSSGDVDFYPRLYNVTRRLESNSEGLLSVEVRKVLGGWRRYQKDYDPKKFHLEDYDTAPAREQYKNQNPFGRQSVVQLEVQRGDESDGGGEKEEGGEGAEGDTTTPPPTAISISDVQTSLSFALSKSNSPVHELRTVSDVGDGFVVSALSPGGSFTVVYDGHANLNVNLFSRDERESAVDRLLGMFLLKLSPGKVTLAQRDDQPRGTGRAINFESDCNWEGEDESRLLSGGELLSSSSSSEAPRMSPGGGKQQQRQYLFTCPVEGMGTGKKSKPDPWENERLTDAIMMEGRGQTYSQRKDAAAEYKSKTYGDHLQPGDSLFSLSCGEGYELLLTLEILHERKDLSNITAYGSDFEKDNVEAANQLLDDQVSSMKTAGEEEEEEWFKKGQFCQGDSVDFVAADTFDVAFTIIEPLADPLRRHGSYVPYEDRARMSKELCGSDDDAADAILVEAEQMAQEDFHSRWVRELIRIVKPGKVVIIEEVDTPLCDESSIKGGVSTKWWKSAVAKYQWDVDIESIEISTTVRGDNKYNVLMRKNLPEPEGNDDADDGSVASAGE